MKRVSATFPISDIDECKQQMLNWCNRFNICCFLDNHHYYSAYHSIECIAAAGAVKTVSARDYTLPMLNAIMAEKKDWLFGHLNYDIHTCEENNTPGIVDPIGFPGFFFFQPETVLHLKVGFLTISTIGAITPEDIYYQIVNEPLTVYHEQASISPAPRISKHEYLNTVKQIQAHIQRGDCYELNFCQEFFAAATIINPLQLYRQLTSYSPNPFSCFYKLDDKYVLCASPERYLQKKGTRLISQPIKGTFKRNPGNPAADEALKLQLQNSEKDKSENVMVVDLVRNDLSRICREGSVRVEELFGVYSFPQVHQMISTISGEMKQGTGFADIISASFPMGSMTGAPKKRVMELIAQYEKTKRGIYSGAIGYIDPERDFDFNVVIRSILYNATNQYLSYLVGGGITFYSDPEKEYEECLLKAEAMNKVLSGCHHPL